MFDLYRIFLHNYRPQTEFMSLEVSVILFTGGGEHAWYGGVHGAGGVHRGGVHGRGCMLEGRMWGVCAWCGGGGACI